VERPLMFMDRKSQYFQDVSSSNLIDKFNVIPTSYFMGSNEVTLKFGRKDKSPKIANAVLRENKVRRLTYLP
jgi:hypothetical protein